MAMDSNHFDFDLDLFLKSFKDVGAEVKPGTGKIFLNGEEIDPIEILKNTFGSEAKNDAKS